MNRYRLTVVMTIQAADKVEAEEAVRIALRSPYVIRTQVVENIGPDDIPEDGHVERGAVASSIPRMRFGV